MTELIGGADVTIWIAFSAGLLSFVSPCVLPLIPSFITYISGVGFGQLQEAHPGYRVRCLVLGHCLLFVLGFSTVFISLGALAGVASAGLHTYLRESLVWVRRGGGLLIFLFGLHLTGLLHFGFLLGEKRFQIHNKPTGYAGSFVIGVAFAAGWTPCIGPILGAIFALAAGVSGSAGRGVLLLAVYSAGLGIPFLLSGLLFHGFLSFFNRFRRYIRLAEIIAGTLLMVVGLLLLSNGFGRMSVVLYSGFSWMRALFYRCFF
jgi:cytochrome c-type biogenesis protein